MRAGLDGTKLTPTLVLGAGALAVVGVGAHCIWRLGRAAAWAEVEAVIKERIDAQDEDAAAVLEAARQVVDAAARRPYILVLAHVRSRAHELK